MRKNLPLNDSEYVLAGDDALVSTTDLKGKITYANACFIAASTQSVSAGTQLAEEAGRTMREIVSSVERVGAVIAEISEATIQQSDGISQVNTAVADLDQATQQNAALVEQTTAATASLSEQAMRLGRSVAVFRLQSVTSETR